MTSASPLLTIILFLDEPKVIYSTFSNIHNYVFLLIQKIIKKLGSLRSLSISSIANKLQNFLSFTFEQSSSSNRIPSSVLTRLNATYACPLANTFLPTYLTILDGQNDYSLSLCREHYFP